MSPMERQIIAERTKAMRDEEKRYTVKFIPTKMLMDELNRRYDVSDQKVTAITTIFNEMADMERNLENLTMLLNAIREVV